ncbi:MAG: S-methyl-5-thioribose-1-phosphate isomerase [Geminicoccaceae bacterium]
MLVQGTPYRTIWPSADGTAVEIIDQTRLPHAFVTVRLESVADAEHAIRAMLVRGAPLIGATAAFGIWLAMRADPSDTSFERAADFLFKARPTAVNLRWALDAMRATLLPLAEGERAAAALERAEAIADDDVAICSRIGDHGLEVFRNIWRRKGEQAPLNVLTHCNAGWLATVDWGTALAPIYKAHDAGIPVHVWVDETRPRNQGASLTAWELLNHGVPHHLIVDNAGGHLMQRGQVDLCIVGTDRTTANGDVCNKIGTYLKALAAHDNGVPFYVALPSPTIDWTLNRGADVPIEERGQDEVNHLTGRTGSRAIETIAITAEGTPAANPAFDVTPARLVTGLITERGVCAASADGLRGLFADRAA